MADTAVAITAGSGTNIDTRTEATNGNHRQVVVLGDPATNAGVAPVDATNGLAVQIIPALPAGSNAIGKLAANSGVNIGTVTVDPTQLSPLGTNTDSASTPVAFSTEGKAQLGSLTETVPATDTASSGLNGRLQRIAQRISSLIALFPSAIGQAATAGALAVTLPSDVSASVAVTLTRTADTNAYLANDILGAATGSTAALTFANVGLSGSRVMITGAQLEIDASAIISGETSYNLYLYNITPPSALGDNAAFDIPSGDRASFLGKISLGAPVDEGSTLYIETQNLNKQVKLSGTSLFAYLVTVGAYTPTSARVHVITLHTVQL